MLVEKLIKNFVAEYECVYGVFFLSCVPLFIPIFTWICFIFSVIVTGIRLSLLQHSDGSVPFEFGAFLRPQFIKHKIFGAGRRMGWLTGWLAGTYTPKKCFTLLDMLSKSPACIFSFTSYVQTPLFLHSWSYFLFILFWFGYLTLSVSLSRLGFVYLDHFLFLCSFYFIL